MILLQYRFVVYDNEDIEKVHFVLILSFISWFLCHFTVYKMMIKFVTYENGNWLIIIVRRVNIALRCDVNFDTYEKQNFCTRYKWKLLPFLLYTMYVCMYVHAIIVDNCVCIILCSTLRKYLDLHTYIGTMRAIFS